MGHLLQPATWFATSGRDVDRLQCRDAGTEGHPRRQVSRPAAGQSGRSATLAGIGRMGKRPPRTFRSRRSLRLAMPAGFLPTLAALNVLKANLQALQVTLNNAQSAAFKTVALFDMSNLATALQELFVAG